MVDLKDRVALVTGSSRGIGAAIARALVEQGARVALHGRDVTALSGVRMDLERAGGRVMQVTGDVTSLADIEAMHREVEQNLGPIDTLVANAGGNVTRPQLPIEEIPEDGFRAALDGNLTATFLTLKVIVPGMKERRRGSIVTMSSAAARRPTPSSPLPYAAAKAGIEVLTQRLALELGSYGIRVNCIAPESILTDRNREAIPDAQRGEMARTHPIRRLGTPDDVARAALFLLSDTAGWISGVILDVAGGSVLTR